MTLILSLFAGLLGQSPEQTLFTFVDDSGRDRSHLTVAQLATQAQAVASLLPEAGLAIGDRAVLVYPPGKDFVVALVACLMAGVVPVPVYPPDPLRPASRLAGFAATVADCGAKVALTNGEYDRVRALGAVKAMFSGRDGHWPVLAWHRTDQRRRSAAKPVSWPRPTQPDEIALLQYTSGSTRCPRGVMITHRNLLAEVAANGRDLGLGADVCGVFWLPQYHDFGLISVILSTLAGNSHSYLLSPLVFLQRPAVWFEVMSRVRATHTAAPDFAFDLSVRKTSDHERAGWDLRSLRVLMSAAEPIRTSTVDAFLAAFAVSGLSPEAFYPAYGLAEHTVSVTMGGRGRVRLSRAALADGRAEPDAAGLEFAGCGRVTKVGARLRIVDPMTGQVCPPGQIGEIWVDSPTKAAGYFGRLEETAETFQARLNGEETTYLRTGDLGFVDDGELYVTGRLKDVVILRGRNYYPQDLENSVRESDPAVRPGGVCIFEADAQLVALVEVRERRVGPEAARSVAQAVRQRVYADHQLGCDVVVVGPPGLVLKTTSGKVRRSACRDAYLGGELKAVTVR